MADIVVVLLILGPAGLTYFLHSNGALVFLSVCGGYMAAALAGNEISDTLSNGSFNLRNTDIDLLFMFLPMALTVFLTTGAASGRRAGLQAIAAGLAGALFVVAGAAFLNTSLHLSLESTALWPQLSRASSFIAGGGVLYSLILVWFFSQRRDKKHK